MRREIFFCSRGRTITDGAARARLSASLGREPTLSELAEETGLIAEELELFRVFSGEEFHHVYPNQDEVYIVDVVYLCKNYTGQLKAQEGEVERLAFFSADGLPEKISPPVKPVLQKWLSKAGRVKL